MTSMERTVYRFPRWSSVAWSPRARTITATTRLAAAAPNLRSHISRLGGGCTTDQLARRSGPFGLAIAAVDLEILDAA
ncbi:hypothetical protein [Nocardia carnea]|uniref:hypothetical protein n=1 Tax=Nocardia carnea TaxID=37328 RepID=UPI0024564BEF|nr:hypothetical protein [Nocardia carnea]